MAPCGSFEAMEAAIQAGCDSIYFGVTQLNMRARASHNFEISDLPRIAQRAKKDNVKTYIALNTLLYDHDLNLMRKLIEEAKKAGIDAVIVADMAAMQYAKEVGISIQASTQLSISNYEAVKFYANFVDTVVLAREVDLKMMKVICDNIEKDQLKGPAGELIKVEVFVHGALCIAQSGRCQMSLLQNNTSAQRGACLQECRKRYRIIDEETEKEMVVNDGYIMSPKDLCTVSFLDELLATGVSILKIEGRGKSADYVDTVVRVYREAADAVYEGVYTHEKVAQWLEKLKEVYNRGFTDGYYLGKPLPDLSNGPGNQAKSERVFAGLVNHYFPKAEVAELTLQASPLKLGDKIVIMGSTTGVVNEEITSIIQNEQSLQQVQNPAMITIKMPKQVRKNDKVYILKSRNLNEETHSCS
ncbi:collagenase-like protease [Candidatus Peregrinibacteria bacterium HGW-Peregrinibacteria-1]|jgi:putative protease|nr:MAG: collagenase-like protease [Candidatus Peregrinibacteria bacterium HGW-Peregrinibacteria-1]